MSLAAPGETDLREDDPTFTTSSNSIRPSGTRRSFWTMSRWSSIRAIRTDLLGVNGAGKSTTLKIIAGTELPNSGKVRRTVRVSWPLGFGRRLPSVDDRPRECAFRGAGLWRRSAQDGDVRRGFLRARRLFRRAGQDLFVRHGRAPRLRHVDVHRLRRLSHRRDHRRRRHELPEAVPGGLRAAAQELERDLRLAFDAGGQRLLRSRRRAGRWPSASCSTRSPRRSKCTIA